MEGQMEMDVKRADTLIDEILDCIIDVANSGSTLYAKSKQRLQHISQVCATITSTVTEVLGQPTNNNPSAQNTVDIASELIALRRDIEMLKSAINVPDEADTSIECNTEVVIDSSNCEQPIAMYDDIEAIVSKPKTTVAKLSPEVMKQLISQYGQTLKLAAVTDQLTDATNQCAGVLWRWFDKRIYTKYPNAPPFHYGAHRLRTIIQAIVIAYSYHFEQGTVDMFLRYFEDWLESLSQSSESNKWVAPYDIYKLERNLTSEYATLTAVVIWDVLTSNGLHDLCDNSNNYMLHENDMWDLVSSVNIDILDNYVNYNADSSILESLNITYSATTL